MLHKTRGIVLKTTNYSETSVVVQVFTEAFGIQSYMVKGARKPRAKIPSNLFQPLNLLDMVVYFKQNADMQRLSELKNNPAFETIPYSIEKSTVLLFLNEMVYKSIRSHSADHDLFEFIYHSLHLLDQHNVFVPNFHLWFLVRLAKYLGFLPGIDQQEKDFFDLKEGVFSNLIPIHPYYLSGDLKRSFVHLIALSPVELGVLSLTAVQRRELLDYIIQYYMFHLEGVNNIKSLAVLQEVLH